MADFTYEWEDWIDPYGKYIYVSPSYELITGYRPDEFMADPDMVIKITHPDDLIYMVDIKRFSGKIYLKTGMYKNLR